MRLKCVLSLALLHASLRMASSITPLVSGNPLPSIAEDIERELAGPARERVLGDLLGPAHCCQLKEMLSTAAVAMPQPDRLLFEARGWEKAIRVLRDNPGQDAQASQRAAEECIASFILDETAAGDGSVGAEGLL